MLDVMTTTPPALHLVPLSGPDLGARHWPLRPPFQVGRSEDSDLLLVDSAVSRRHLSIVLAGNAWEVIDQGSRHGTYLNELRLPAQEGAALRAGDELRVGPWRFRVELAANAPTHEAPVVTLDGTASPIERLGNLAEQRLDLLLQAARELVEAEDEAALGVCLAEYALLGSGYTRSAVLRLEGNTLHTVVLRPEAAAEDAPPVWSRSLVESAQETGLSAIEAAEGEALNRTLMHLPLRRALCATIRLDHHVDSFLYLDSDRPRRDHHADAPSFCHALARFGSLALAGLRRRHAERGRLALETEMQRARSVQQHLLPAAEGVLAGWSYALHLEPGRSVGGDLADAFALPDGRCAALLGDVSGTGVAAGLLMASVQAFLRAELAHETDPAQAVAHLNTYLCARSSGRFVTLWLGLFSGDGAVEFVDAGHGLAWIGGNATHLLDAHGGIPLGIDPGAHYATESVRLETGEALLLCSDGVTEQRDAEGEAYGAERVLAAVADGSNESATQRMARVCQDLQRHRANTPVDDDTTLLLLHRAPC